MVIDMDMKKVDEIVQAYQQTITNIREALALAGVPKPMIELYITNLPSFSDMLPDDVVSLYKQFLLSVVIYLSKFYSQREIVKRIGGVSYLTVNKILKEREKVSSFEEVTISK